MTIRYTNTFDGLPARLRKSASRYSLRTRILTSAAILAVLAGGGYWIWSATAKKNQGRPPAAVVIATASGKDVTIVEHTMGTVIANATVQITPQVTGQLLRANFQEGQIVKKGDLLFEIDPRPFQAALQQAEAAQAKDDAIRINAEVTKKRYDALFAQNAISSSQKDAADAAAKSAIATVQSDRAQVEIARLNLSYTQIRSPVNGKTGPILIQPGNLVIANSANPLVTIAQIEPVKVSLALPQSDLGAIQIREKSGKLVALIDTHKPGTKKLSAKIGFVSNQVSNTTGTIELRADFDNADHQLVPGQQVDVDVTLGDLHKATVVPREAVNDGPQGRYVFVVSPEFKATMRPVTVLFDDGTMIAVKGVAPKEKVIVDGQLRVIPGATVQIAKGKKGGGKPDAAAKTP